MTAVLVLLAAYLLLGAAFALAFVTRGAGRIDPAARNGPIGFRIMIAPGAAALWPVLLLRWIRSGRGNAQ